MNALFLNALFLNEILVIFRIYIQIAFLNLPNCSYYNFHSFLFRNLKKNLYRNEQANSRNR
jgi:hypothetical protein